MDDPSSSSGSSPSPTDPGLSGLPTQSAGVLDRTIGALLIGAFLSTILYGLGLHQTYRYARLYPKDTPFIRFLVISVFVLETLQVIFCIHASYHALVTNYFNPTVLLQLSWSENLITVTGCLIIITCEMFFIRRVSLISFKYKVVSWLASLFLVAKLAGDIALSVKGFSSNSAFTTYTNNTRMIVPPLVAVTIVNALMTGAIIACLRQSRATYKEHDSYFDLAVLYGINTGLLILIADFIMLVLVLHKTRILEYKAMMGIASVFLVATLVGDILMSFYGFDKMVIDLYTNQRADKHWLLAMTLGSLTAVNFLVTGSLLAVMRHARKSETGAESYIDMGVIYVINTGVLILILDLASLILAVAYEGTLYWVAIHLVSAKLYANTLLSVLNSRKLLVSRGVDVFDAGTFGSGIITRANRIAAVERWNVPQAADDVPPAMIDIKVTTEIEGTDSAAASQADGKVGHSVAFDPRGRSRV